MAEPSQNELIQFIAGVAGERIATQIWKEFQGTQIYIPRFPKEIDERQLYLVNNLHKKSVRELARDLDLTTRQVYKLMGKPVRPKQISLF